MEKYNLNWKGKSQALLEVESATNTIVVYVPEGSATNSNNLFIEGDNIDALKHLKSAYFGKIDAICIDPPYNTGNKNFVYEDNFGSTHDSWLSMIYPRLILSKDLLTPNGIIFISIDQNELANLKIICDEIFGKDNFIDIFNWVKTETPANLAKKSKKVIEYILCYQNNKDSQKFTGIKKESKSTNGLLNQTNKVNTLRFPENIVKTKLPNQIIVKGLYGTDSYDIELLEDTEICEGVFIKPVILRSKFKWTQSNLDLEISKSTELFILSNKLSPSYQKKEYSAEVPPNLINSKVGVDTNEIASFYLDKMFGGRVFDYPKPVSLIKYLLKFNNNLNGVYLDFFAGSGTLAEAVIDLNNEDSGSRSFICVQFPEELSLDSFAYSLGYRTISDITSARISKITSDFKRFKLIKND